MIEGGDDSNREEIKNLGFENKIKDKNEIVIKMKIKIK